MNNKSGQVSQDTVSSILLVAIEISCRTAVNPVPWKQEKESLKGKKEIEREKERKKKPCGVLIYNKQGVLAVLKSKEMYSNHI